MLTGSAVVTGAAKGIGREITAALLSKGVTVVGVDQDAEALVTAADQLRGVGSFLAVVGDVADRPVLEEAARIAAEQGELKIWVNNAGYNVNGSAREVDQATAERGVAVLLYATLWGTQIALGYMLANSGGAIINMSSVQAVRGMPSRAVYAMCKGGVESLTRQVALEYAHKNIRVNAIAPGAIQTDIDGVDYSDPKNVQAVVDAAVPVGWYGQPKDVAKAALFLADPEMSAYITGQVITVDGGFAVAGPNWQPEPR